MSRTGYKIICLLSLATVACTHKYSVEVPTEDMDRFGLTRPARSIRVEGNDNEFAYTVFFNRFGSRERVITDNPDGSYRCTEFYSYDKSNRLIEQKTINADNETEGRWVWEYCDDGQIRSRTFYGMNNDEQHRFCYEYLDSTHFSCTYTLEAMPMSRTEVTINGMVKEEVSYDEDGQPWVKVHEEYLREGKPTKVESDDGMMDLEIRYDDKDLPVWTRNTSLNSENGFVWNEDLNVHHERFYDYSFDRKGNWTERRERKEEGGDIIATVKRRIRY